EHELRGPLTAFGLALDAARGTPAGRRLAFVLDAELARAGAGLADLAAARSGRRAPPRPGPVPVDRMLRSSAAAWGAKGRVDAAVGPLVPVLVTRTGVEAGARLKAGQLAVRRVPSRFAPRDALSAPDGVAGQRSAVALPAGSYVTAAALDTGAGRDAGGGIPI